MSKKLADYLYYEEKEPNLRIYCGDSVEIMKLLPSSSVDAVITDPPYGIDLQPQRKITEAIQNDTADKAQVILAQSLIEFQRLLKPDTNLFIFGGWSEDWFVREIKKVFDVKSCIVWVKNNFGIGYYTRPQHEFIWYCHKGSPVKPAKPISDVIFRDKIQAPVHSCEKPVSLITQFIETFEKAKGGGRNT